MVNERRSFLSGLATSNGGMIPEGVEKSVTDPGLDALFTMRKFC